MTRKFQVTFWGGVGSVTGANFLLEGGEEKFLKIMFDCGLVQGESYATEENRKSFSYDPSTIDFLFITHAHADHIGLVPKLVKDGFNGVIYSTPETRAITEIMLEDTVKIMNSEAADKLLPPLYSMEDVRSAMSLWKNLPYHTTLTLPGGISVYVKDAGHVLGSAMYEVAINGKKIVFTGDLGNTPAPLLRDTEDIVGAKYLVMESVYGDRNHESKKERRAKLADVIKETINKKGTLIIPAFSLERTQVILYELNKLVEEGTILSIPVFLDSPLAIKVTGIYKKMRKDFNPAIQAAFAHGDDVFDFPKLKLTRTVQESHKIDLVPNPKIIIAGGGMSEGGRVIGHERNYLPDERNTVVLVGYQAAGTLGRSLLEGAKSVVIQGQSVPVRASIEIINGYSSHKDSDHLIEFASEAAETLKEVFVVMGEPKASMFLAQRLKDYVGLNAIYPERGKRYELEF